MPLIPHKGIIKIHLRTKRLNTDKSMNTSGKETDNQLVIEADSQELIQTHEITHTFEQTITETSTTTSINQYTVLKFEKNKEENMSITD